MKILTFGFGGFETVLFLLIIVVEVAFVDDEDALHNFTGDNVVNSTVFSENHFGNFEGGERKLAVEKLAER